MFNPIETYAHAGKMAGKAARAHDMGLLRHWASWRDQAVRLETPDDAKAAREAYAAAYSQHARG